MGTEKFRPVQSETGAVAALKPPLKRCSRTSCERQLTFADSKAQYGRLCRAFGKETAKALSPMCQKCTTLTIDSPSRKPLTSPHEQETMRP